MPASARLAAVRDGSIAAHAPPGDFQGNRRLADLLLEVARCLNRDVAEVLPSRLDGDLRLEALRSVLLEEDRAALAVLQQKFDDPRQLTEAVSAVLANAIALAAARDERLGTVLAPILEHATRASIRNDPGTLVGLLYPIVGPAIRKSIAESLDGTLKRLNQAFKHSVSWQGVKWRLEAYRSGSTFAEVVLKHTVVFRVEHLFLIHRKTGLLLEHIADAEAATQDPHLVSGMLTAIQDFARDSFSQAKGTDASGIDTLRLGDLLLWCEEGPFAFLAAVIRGNPPESLHAVLREALAGIHEELRSTLEEFSGDGDTLGNLAARLEACLQRKDQLVEKHLSPWLWALPLALLVLVGSWIAVRRVEQNRVDAYVEALREQPGVVVTGAERRRGQWHVWGLRDPLAADPAEVLAQSSLDPSRVVGHWEPYEALNPAIVLKRIAASLNPPPGVALALDGNTIRASGNAPQHWVDRARALIAALPAGSPAVDLSSLKDIQEPTFVRLRDAIQGHVITFDSNAPLPASGQDAALDTAAGEIRELIGVARSLGFSVQIMIVGHADATGKETSNLTLSAARAEVVRSMLRRRGIAPDLLLVRSAGTFEPEQARPEGQGLPINRRVTFTVSTSD